jgi:hypothetical protein
MFENWENFYLIVGSGAAALIGLMFVAASLSAGFEKRTIMQGAPIFMTPIVFHFAIVVVVSAIAVVPDMAPPAIGIALMLCAAVGLIYCAVTIVRMFAVHLDRTPDFSDRVFYGFLPAVIYVGLAGAASWTWVAPRMAAYAVGATTLVFLLIGIRNAWDLATFFVMRPPDAKS